MLFNLNSSFVQNKSNRSAPDVEAEMKNVPVNFPVSNT